MFPRVQLTIFQHWLRLWLGAGLAIRHNLNQWWLVYWRIYASPGLSELATRSLVDLIISEKLTELHDNIQGPQPIFIVILVFYIQHLPCLLWYLKRLNRPSQNVYNERRGYETAHGYSHLVEYIKYVSAISFTTLNIRDLLFAICGRCNGRSRTPKCLSLTKAQPSFF